MRRATTSGGIVKLSRLVSVLALSAALNSPVRASETIVYSYDALGRLNGVAHTGTVNNGVSTGITYDPAGNRMNYTVSTNVVLPTLSIADVSATEGSSLAFKVTLSAASASTVTVGYSSSNGTAVGGSDFAVSSGTLTFAPGETAKTIIVATNEDAIVEGNETFTVTLSGASGATLARSVATGTIVDNDVAPAILAIGNASVTEGGTLVFTVTRSGNTAIAASAAYATAGGTATSGADFTATSGTISFASGQTSATINVPTTDDTVVESAETMTVTLSNPSANTSITTATGTGTINDNDQTVMVARNPSLSYSSSSTYSIAIATLATLNGHAAQITAFTLPSGKGSATIVSSGQVVTYTTPSVSKPALCEAPNTISFSVPYTVQDTSGTASVGGVAYIAVTGPQNLPTGNQQCP